jgi:hypothetical protein
LEKVVLYSKEIEFYLNDLIDILYHKEYFSYSENAENYVFDLKEEIENRISTNVHYSSPTQFSNLAKNYIVVSVSKRTSWYVFFDKKDNRYLVTYITNKHVEEAKNL